MLSQRYRTRSSRESSDDHHHLSTQRRNKGESMPQTVDVICASSGSLPYLIVTLPRRRHRLEHVLLHIKHSYTLLSSAATHSTNPTKKGVLGSLERRRHLFFLLSPWEQFFALSCCLAFLLLLLLIIVYLGSHLAGSDPLPMPWFSDVWLGLLCR